MKIKKHCEVWMWLNELLPRGRSPHSSSSFSQSTRVCLLILSCPLECTRWPWRGPLVSPQCLSLARGVCTLTSLKIPEDRFRTRVSDRLPWKDLDHTSQNKQEKCSSTTDTHRPFPTCMYNRKRAPYTKEEGNLILNRVKNQLALEQAERTRKRVEELNSSARSKPESSTDTHTETNLHLSSSISSSTQEEKTLTEDLELPSWLTSRSISPRQSCPTSVRTISWIHLNTQTHKMQSE